MRLDSLPITYDKPYEKNCENRIFTSFSLQRSGQHVVIDWICRGLVDVIHLNHCRFFRVESSLALSPVTGRRVLYSENSIHDSGVQGRGAYRNSLPQITPKNIFYSVEDLSLKLPEIQKLLSDFRPVTIIILRDPANWLASSIRYGKYTPEELLDKIAVLKDYIRFAINSVKESLADCIAINFNRFIQDKDYRILIAGRIGLLNFEKAEEALGYVPDFGGGSSFGNGQGKSDSVLNRYLEYSDTDFFRDALNDRELIKLAKIFFGKLPYE